MSEAPPLPPRSNAKTRTTIQSLSDRVPESGFQRHCDGLSVEFTTIERFYSLPCIRRAHEGQISDTPVKLATRCLPGLGFKGILDVSRSQITRNICHLDPFDVPVTFIVLTAATFGRRESV